MAINKVVYGGNTLIDLTGDTLEATDAAKVVSGVKVHARDGTQLTGTFAGQEKSATPSTSAQTVTPDSGKYLSKVNVGAIQTQTKAVTPSASSQNVTPDSGKFLSQVTVNGDANLIAANIKNNVTIFGVTGSLKDSQHYAHGYKTMTANASFEVTGIVDQQGNTFTPKGYIFVIAPNTTGNTDITGGSTSSSNDLVICYYDSVNNNMHRNIVWTPACTIRCNPGVSSQSVGSGTFKQTASSSKPYNCMGQRYFWLAWG